MIVKCAYCGPLPLADLEELGDEAWDKHVAEKHPTWPKDTPTMSIGYRPAHIDGQADA